jgi:hypothetical protein
VIYKKIQNYVLRIEMNIGNIISMRIRRQQNWQKKVMSNYKNICSNHGRFEFKTIKPKPIISGCNYRQLCRNK